jgi:hypothetical protein
MPTKFQMSLPGSRPLLDGAEVTVPAQFYQRLVLGGQVTGLWIGGQRVYGVSVLDPAGRPIGSIGPLDAVTSEEYDRLQRVLVAEALRG